MHEWLEGLKKSAKRMASGVALEDIRRAETEDGVPFPEELSTLYQACNGGEFQGEVTLFPLHGPEGAPSVLEKTRLKLEGLPAAGLWRFGVKGTHRQLFTSRASAMREQADGPLPGWMDALGEDDWVYGTWETETSELRLYRSLHAMLEVLVPPAEVEEFGDRTYAMALSAVQGALSDLEEGGEEEEAAGEQPEAAAAGETDDKDLAKPVVDAARRRVEQLKKPKPAKAAARKAAAGAKKAVKKAASKVKGAAKKVVAQAKKAAKKAPVKKAAALVKKAAKKAVAKKAPAKKAPVKKAPAKKAAAKKAQKGPARKALSKLKARGRR